MKSAIPTRLAELYPTCFGFTPAQVQYICVVSETTAWQYRKKCLDFAKKKSKVENTVFKQFPENNIPKNIFLEWQGIDKDDLQEIIKSMQFDGTPNFNKWKTEKNAKRKAPAATDASKKT